MRSLVLLSLLATAAACGTDHYGAYLELDGAAAPAFDHVDAYFGAKLASKGYGTPAGAAAKGVAYRRLAATSDSFDVRPGTTRATFYVPPGGDNALLGDYVLVVASAGGKPVAIGEYTAGFTVPTAKVAEYAIPLEPFDDRAAVWAGGECAAWDRARAGTGNGVVRQADRDCDDYPRDKDCDDLAYCKPGQSCSYGSDGVVGSGVTCAIGACTNAGGQQQLAPTTCVNAAACDECKDVPNTAASRLACAAMRASDHVVIQLPVDPNGVVCTDSAPYAAVASSVMCPNPMIAYVTPTSADGYTFHLSNTATDCRVLIQKPTTTQSVPFDKDAHHLVISFGATLPWHSVLVGFEVIQVDACPTSTTPQLVPGNDPIADCM